MANDAPDWQQLVQFPSAQQINISEVTAASLPANVINAYLSAFGSVAVPKWTYNINNLAPNAIVSTVITNIPENFYDEITFQVNSSGGQLGNLKLWIDQQRYQAATGGSTFLSPSGGSVVPRTGAGYDNKNASYTSDPVLLDPTFQTNAVDFVIQNISGSAISDTLTIFPFLKYSSDVITNPNTNPVQIQGIHGSNSISGAMTLPSSTSTTVPGSANTVVTRLIVTPYNQNAAALGALDRIFVEVNGVIAAVIPIGGLAANTFGQPVQFDFGDGIALGANGIQLNPNDNVQAYVATVTK